MPNSLIFQPSSGASGDMILGALLDILKNEKEFIRVFERLGLDVRIAVRNVAVNHLTGKRVTVDVRSDSPLRRFSDIQRFIRKSPFSGSVKERALKVFENIFRAEADVHGEPLRDVHLHEVGADDSIIDIVGFSFLWEKLDFCPIFYTTLVTGKGHVRTRHGTLPVPPPAVLNLIRGKSFSFGETESELLTPTGAAILVSHGTQIPPGHVVRPVQIGTGAGHRTFQETPNILRAFLAETEEAPAGNPVWVLEFSVDDMTGEALAHFAEKAMAQGALDIFIQSGLMKKGRIGHHVTILSPEKKWDDLATLIFRESSSIGLRIRRENRIVLHRQERTIRVDGRNVRLKISRIGNEPVTVKPEFTDVAKYAAAKKIALKQALKRIEEVFHEKN
jgi:hypothetical protein